MGRVGWGRNSGGGAGVTYSAEAQAYFAAMTTQGTDTYKSNINTFIQKLKDDGVWASLDSLHLFANKADSTDAVPASFINMISPADTKAAKIGSPTYVHYQGWKGVTASAIDLSQALSGRAKFKLNTGCIFFYIYETTAAAFVIDAGVYNSVSQATVIYSRITGDAARLYFNSGHVDSGALAGSGLGMFSFNRTSNTNIDIYRAGSFVEGKTLNVGSIPTANLYALANNQNSTTISLPAINRVMGLIGFGDQMDATKQQKLQDAFAAYMAAPK
ncbi:MAG TPA: hypothetical protein PL124_09700 [Candidatus Cloacimonadota bacterium]|nr:hypothetical protein [Candidatus Cloacimonadota bacterium]HPS39673.1 hypothetical protein [Candidatus Cloacimonadota bacterium]